MSGNLSEEKGSYGFELRSEMSLARMRGDFASSSINSLFSFRAVHD